MRSKSDGESDSYLSPSLNQGPDGMNDAQRRQSRIRTSLADMFARMKRSMSIHSLDEVCYAAFFLWSNNIKY